MHSPFPNYVVRVARNASGPKRTEHNPYKIGCPTDALKGQSLKYLQVSLVRIHFAVKITRMSLHRRPEEVASDVGCSRTRQRLMPSWIPIYGFAVLRQLGKNHNFPECDF
jgi:hypothetical protein